MDEQKYQNQKLIEYLLGSMPTAEAEKFDESSVTDDNFADALDAAEKDLLDGYARGNLSGERLEKFNAHYLASPLRREKVAFAETFQLYAEKSAARENANSLSAEPKTDKPPVGFFSSLNFFKNFNAAFQWSFVIATLLIAAAAGFWILNSRTSKEEIARQNQPPIADSNKQIQTTQPENSNEVKPSAANSDELFPVNKPANNSTKTASNTQPARTPVTEKTVAPPKITVASFVLLPSLRGGGKLENLTIAKNATDVKITLKLETDDFAVYRVALTDETGAVNLWQSGKVKSFGKGENKTLSVRFPAKLLKSKIYTLVVSGLNTNGEDEIIGNYPFRSVLR